MVQEKLSGEERKLAIVEAARPLFAAHGFEGTTTRQIAQAAGVSEALLFKYFPNKEALYGELLACCHPNDPMVLSADSLEPGVESLVLIFAGLMARIFLGPLQKEERKKHDAFKRLMIYSILEGSGFARTFMAERMQDWGPRIEACWKAAQKSGDLDPPPGSSQNAMWLVHHLALSLALFHLSNPPAVNYGESKEALFKQAAWFALRGIGVREEVIRKSLTGKKLTHLLERLRSTTTP